MRLSRMRVGESVALVGAICLIVALKLRWYEVPRGSLSAWETFGPAVVLLMLAALAGLVLALATLTERTTALPVAAAVWTTLIGFIAVIAAIVRVLERPQGASGLCAGAWLALAGALLVLVGAWLSLRDERPGMYPPSEVEPRPAP